MPLFGKNKSGEQAGVNASRASKILSGLAPKDEGAEGSNEDLEAKKAAEEAAAQKAADEQASQEAAKAAEDQEAQKAADEQAANDAATLEAQKAADEEAKKAADEAANNNNNQDLGKGSKSPDLSKGTQELTEEVLLKNLSEKLGRTIESLDDLTPAAVEVDPEIQQLQDWKKETGLSLTQFSEYTRDFSQLSDVDVVRETLTKNSPNFTKEELEYKMRDYTYDPENDEESDRVAKSIKLKEAAQLGRQQMEKNHLSLKEAAQNKGVLSEDVQNMIEYAKTSKAQADQSANDQKVYEDNIRSASNDLNAIDLQLNDEFNIKFNLPEEVKNSLPNMVAEMPTWRNEDGTVNAQTVVSDIAKVANFDKIVQAAFEQGINVGKEGMIKKSGNITPDVIAQKDDEGSKTKGNVQEVVSKISGRNGKRKNLRFRSTNN